MRNITAVFVLAVLCWVGSTACASKTQTNLGDPAVYTKIQDSTSCTELQVIFDQADADRKAALSRSNADLADVTFAYMKAADDRTPLLG
jgi:spermidine/putrescine-binding protein